MQVAPNTTPVEVAKIDVDGSGDGGLLDIALSPTFVEDNLIYAYVTTGTDNRVVRIAPGDTAKEVLGGIPRGASGNGGSLEFAAPDQLMVLTGDTGNPAVAQDPASLAGKLLRVRSLTPNAAPPRPEVVLSGIGNGGGVCVDPGIATWVTDRTTLEDRLQRVGADGTVTSPAWTWPDRPGVGGCIAAQGVVAVALGAGKAISALAADPGTGAVTTAPSAVGERHVRSTGRFGTRIRRFDVGEHDKQNRGRAGSERRQGGQDPDAEWQRRDRLSRHVCSVTDPVTEHAQMRTLLLAGAKHHAFARTGWPTTTKESV